MNENIVRYVIDPSHFCGACITTMKDGVRGDYYGETIEELREKHNNQTLISITDERMLFLLNRYVKSLQLPFSEITEARFNDYMNCVPPKRFARNQFFVGECYIADIYSFCFELNGKFYEGLRPIKTPDAELTQQIREFEKHISFKPNLIKGELWGEDLSEETPSQGCISYFFEGRNGEQFFIDNLSQDTTFLCNKQPHRNELANSLVRLRKHHYEYFTCYGKHESVFEFFKWVQSNNYTILIFSALFEYDECGSVNFRGSIKELSNTFHYRIYDRNVVKHIINLLRTVKREFA